MVLGHILSDKYTKLLLSYPITFISLYIIIKMAVKCYSI